MSRKWMFVLPALILLLAACGGSSSPLTGVTWKLVSYGTADESLAAVPDVETSLVFGEDGNAAGTMGCNQFNGAYEIRGDQITFGPMASTLMACEEPLMNQETAVLAILSDAATFKISGDTLTITAGDGSVATFGQ
jgi:heat shock protein HslJ